MRLDFEDPLWSNIDVAICNIVESHIGAVAANILLTGPVITRLGNQFDLSAMVPSSLRRETEKQSSSKYPLGSHHGIDRGFRRMDNRGSGDRALIGVTSPRIVKGSFSASEGIYALEEWGKGRIKVKTDLEQEVGFSTPAATEFVG